MSPRLALRYAAAALVSAAAVYDLASALLAGEATSFVLARVIMLAGVATGLWLGTKAFGDVRPGEGGAVLLMSTNIFLLLVGYYILKTVREPLILVGGGAELKAYASAAQAVALMLFVPAYGWIASRLSRPKLILTFVLFFLACLELFWLGGRLRLPHIGFVFYVWVGIFSLATIAQFWSFANDLYTREKGDRLFPLIAVGMTAGAPLGSWIAGWLFDSGVDPFLMMQIAAGLLLLHLGLYAVVQKTEAAAARTSGEPQPTEAALAKDGGFALVFRSPYLRIAAGLLVVLNLVNTTGEYILSRSVVEMATAAAAGAAEFDKESYIGSFYGRFFFWVNVATILVQAFLVSRLVRYLGFAGVLLTLPIVALGTYGLVASGVGFVVLRLAKTAENASDYSIMNTARQMMWLPTSREEKYKAKQALDTFFVRAGDVLSAGLVFAGTSLGLGIRGFAGVNLVLIALWLALGIAMLRYYRSLCETCR